MSEQPGSPEPAETSAEGVVQAVPVEQAQPGPGAGPETITEPAKLLRIASMVRELLEETRQTTLDDAGRKRLAAIYDRAVGELSESLSADLKDELAELAPPLDETPSDAEIRVAQAQLVGWLEGLFHGIQAAMFAQQAAARAQFEELRRRGLPGGQPDQQPSEGGRPQPGQYL